MADSESVSSQARALERDLAANRRHLKSLFSDCADLVLRDLTVGQVKALLLFIDGMVDAKQLQDSVLSPLLFEVAKKSAPLPGIGFPTEQAVTAPEVKKVHLDTEVAEAILAGQAVFLLDGQAAAFLLDVRGGERRAVEEPMTEVVVRGPREGFTESIRTNVPLLRRKIRTPNLKTVKFTIGEQTKTTVILAYIKGVAPEAVIDDVKQKLQAIKIDGVLESGYLEEKLEAQPYSPFPELLHTERPDTVAAQLLEGRFAIFTDGTPFVLTAPVTVWSFFQSSEDYYERFISVTPVRWIRYFFVVVALYTPAIYVAMTTFHQDMVPTTLLLSIAKSREVIPFPAVLEALMMELAFEALREAGIRLPRVVGQAVGILGALVIGQAVVEAGIVSAPVVIVVSITGIASFTIPRYNAAIAVRLLRFPILMMAGAFGLLGIIVTMFLIILHLCQLKSFGLPYMTGIAPIRPSWFNDIVWRGSWRKQENTRRRAQ